MSKHVTKNCFRKIITCLLAIVFIATLFPVNHVNASASASTKTVEFYYCSPTRDIFIDNGLIANHQIVIKDNETGIEQTATSDPTEVCTSAGNPVYKITYDLAPGAYRYEGKTRGDAFAGAGVFIVEGDYDDWGNYIGDTNGTQKFYLTRFVFGVKPPGISMDDKGSDIYLYDYLGNELDPYEYNEHTGGGFISKKYLLIMRSEEFAYKYEVVPKSPNYSPATGTRGFNMDQGELQLQQATSPLNNQLTVTPYANKEMTFKVTKGADFHVYSKRLHFTPFFEYKASDKDSDTDPKYDIYTITVPVQAQLHYEAGGGQYVKYCQKFHKLRNSPDDFTITIDLEPNDGHREDTKYMDDELYLNTDDSRFVEIPAGGCFDLFPIRVWQAQRGETENYFTEPDFHFEIIDPETGNSKTLDSFQFAKDSSVENASIALTPKGARGRETYRITGLSTGLSIIKITYDPIVWLLDPVASDSYTASSNRDKRGQDFYSNPLEDRNTAVVIVNVGGADSSQINTNIEQREYDTIYFDQKDGFADYRFSPQSELGQISVRVHDPLHNTDWNDQEAWTDYGSKSSGESFTVKLKDGRNIIEVRLGNSVKYHVVNARAVKVNIENLSNPAWQEGEPVSIGDSIAVSFASTVPNTSGIKLPLEKIAAIYNPGFPQGCYVVYEKSTGGTITSTPHVQYTIGLDNTVVFTVSEPSKLSLTNGRIYCTHYGHERDYHRNIPEEGLAPFMYAPNYEGDDCYYCILPDINVLVEDDDFANDRLRAEWASLFALKESPPSSVYHYEVQTEQNITSLPPLPPNIVGEGGNKISFSADCLTVNQTGTQAKRMWINSPRSDIPFDPATVASDITLKMIGELNDIVYAEQRISAGDTHSNNFPKTYTFRLISPEGTAYGKYPYITDFKLTPNTGAFESYFDGKLLAVDENRDSLDLGYGFLSTRERFATSVPYSVDSIRLTATPLTEGEVTTVVSMQKANGEVLNGAVQDFALDEGENVITVTGKVGEETISYEIIVTRAAAPTAFAIATEDGTTLTIRDAKGYRIEPNAEDGKYSIPVRKGYKYYYEKPGYLTKTGTFDVEEDTTSITLPSFTDKDKIAQTNGSASVTVAAQNSLLRDQHTVAFDIASVPNLAQQGYVEYNHGGYTVLHALLNALDACRADYKCFKGVLTPQTKTSGDLGMDAGWICEVNGVKVTDYASTLVKDGDDIAFYYNADTSPDMLHAWFEETSLSAPKDGSATLTLKATPVGNSDPDTKASPVAGAAIYMAGKELGKTDAKGQITLDNLSDLSLGTYAVTARKADEKGNEMLTYACALLTVTKTDSGPTPGDKIAVSFRLIGATPSSGEIDLSKGDYKGSEYVTWIKTTSYTLNRGSKVYDLFTKALGDAGLQSAGAEQNYVRSIYAPSEWGSYELSEFTNGHYSGWMYTVNGSHPNVGLKDYELNDGDEVIWHYVNDYRYEVHDWFDGSLGNSSTWSKWLEAADETLESNEEAVAKAKTAIENQTWTVPMDTANTEQAVKAWIESEIANLDMNGVTAIVTMDSFTPAVAGTEANPSGTEGNFNFTVNLNKGEGDTLATDNTQITGTITAYPVDNEDAAAAKNVDNLITAISDPVTLGDKTAIESARAAYNALTQEQKDLVTKLAKLEAAETTLADLQAAKDAEDKIAAIGIVTLESKSLIDTAREAYDALTDEQAMLVSNYQTLLTAEEAYAALMQPIKETEGLINKLPDTISTTEMTALAKASEAYNNLSDDEKTQIDAKLKTKLSALQNEAAAINHTSNGVQISGVPWNIILTAVPFTAGEDYEAMQKLGAGRTVLGMYDLSLQSLDSNGNIVEYQLNGETATITLTVKDLAKYKEIKIIHQLPNGEYEYITPTEIDGSKITFVVKSLSKYAVTGKLIETASETTPTTGDDQGKSPVGPVGGKQIKTVPATGDPGYVLMMIMFLLAVLCAGGYVYCKKARGKNSI